MPTTTEHPRGGAAPSRVDLSRVRPYGDALDDGKIQLSFTLPVPHGAEAEEAARRLLGDLRLDEPQVARAQDLGDGFTFFIVYAVCARTVDYGAIRVPRAQKTVMDRQTIESTIRDHIRRPIHVIGACTGSDAHTVGIDAILNFKGIDGHKGLESYKGFDVVNLGAQVSNTDLVRLARERGADALLVSQVVTQKNVHIQNLTELVELVEAEGLRDDLLLVVGGPRVGHELAMELGYDAGFGRGSFAADVASFLVESMMKRVSGGSE